MRLLIFIIAAISFSIDSVFAEKKTISNLFYFMDNATSAIEEWEAAKTRKSGFYRPARGPLKGMPVYSGPYIPQYIKQYQKSKNLFAQLLAGLSLMNVALLGIFGEEAKYYRYYTPKQSEKCYFGAETQPIHETEIDCTLISSFILQEENKIAKKIMEPEKIPQQKPRNLVLLGNGKLEPIETKKGRLSSDLPATIKTLRNFTLSDNTLCYFKRVKRRKATKSNLKCKTLLHYRNILRNSDVRLLLASCTLIPVILRMF